MNYAGTETAAYPGWAKAKPFGWLFTGSPLVILRGLASIVAMLRAS